MTSFDDLPNEIILYIFRFLDFETLCAFRSINKKFRELYQYWTWHLLITDKGWTQKIGTEGDYSIYSVDFGIIEDI